MSDFFHKIVKKTKNVCCLSFATVFNIGFLPLIPGTFGSIAAVLLAIVVIKYTIFPNLILYITIFITIFSIPIINYILKYPPKIKNSKTIKKIETDPSYIVIDEVIGQLITILIISYIFPLTIWKILVCFFYFRIFDILKPWPIYQIETNLGKTKKYKSLGIVLDDVIAGILASIAAYYTFLFYP